MKYFVSLLLMWLLSACFVSPTSGYDAGMKADFTYQPDNTTPADADIQQAEADLQQDAADSVPDADSVDVSGIEVIFDDRIRTAIITEISRAKKSVLFTTYQFRDDAVMNALNGLHDDGVLVRGAVGSQPETAAAARFQITVLPEETGIMHEKFFIIDDTTLLVSSSNLAFNNIKNFLVIIRKDVLGIAAFKKEFEELFASRRGTAKTSACPGGCVTPWGTIYFSPGSCNAVTSLLNDSKKKTNYLAMYNLTDSAPMFDTLAAIPKSGGKLIAILDDWEGTGGMANADAFGLLKSAGATVSYYSGSMVYHHKFFVNADKVEFGSMNWTYSGCSENDEFFVISNLQALVQPFLAYIK